MIYSRLQTHPGVATASSAQAMRVGGLPKLAQGNQSAAVRMPMCLLNSHHQSHSMGTGRPLLSLSPFLRTATGPWAVPSSNRWSHGSTQNSNPSFTQLNSLQQTSSESQSTQNTAAIVQQQLAARHARRHGRSPSPAAEQALAGVQQQQQQQQESTTLLHAAAQPHSAAHNARHSPAAGLAHSAQTAETAHTRQSLPPTASHSPHTAPHTPPAPGSLPVVQAASNQPRLLSAVDRLYQQLTEPRNALENILDLLVSDKSDFHQVGATLCTAKDALENLLDLLAFKKVKHSTLLGQLLQLHQAGRISQEQLARLYDISLQPYSQTGLTWQDITAAFGDLPSKLRGKQKQCEAVHQVLQSTHSMQLEAQEARHPGITELQIPLVQQVLQASNPDNKQKHTAVAAGIGPEYASALSSLGRAAITKARLYLEGHSVEEIARPPLSGKRAIQEKTVRTQLLEAVKAGVPLPKDRLLHDFRLTGVDGGLTFDAVRAMVQRLQQQQQDTPNFTWYNSVRSHLLMDEEPTKSAVEAQEADLGESEGWTFTLDQIRLVTHLCRQEQQQQAQQLEQQERQPLQLHGMTLTQPVSDQDGHMDEDLIAAARQGFQHPDEAQQQQQVAQPVGRPRRRSRGHSRLVHNA